MVDPQIWSSEDFQTLPHSTEVLDGRLLWLSLISFAEDYGHDKFSLWAFKSRAFPQDNYDLAQFDACIKIMQTKGMIEIQNEIVFLRNWKKWQYVEKPSKMHPHKDAFNGISRGVVGEELGSPPDNRMERNGKERKGNPPNPPARGDGRKQPRCGEPEQMQVRSPSTPRPIGELLDESQQETLRKIKGKL